MSPALLSALKTGAARGRSGASAATSNTLARSAWDRAQRERDAGDLAAARQWLERAHRLVPDDPLVRLTLGALCLELGDTDAAAPLLAEIAREHDIPDAWVALAACHLARTAEGPCVDALEHALRSSVPTPALAELAGRVVERFRWPGWCGLDSDGRVRFGPGRPARIALDGVVVRGGRLPPSWQMARMLEASGRAGPFLGSPLPVQRLRAVSGFVTADAGGIEGWAWHPADPNRDPLVLLRGTVSNAMLTLTESAEDVDESPSAGAPRAASRSPPRRSARSARRCR